MASGKCKVSCSKVVLCAQAVLAGARGAGSPVTVSHYLDDNPL